MFNELDCVGLDFETYGSRPLPTCGLENYVKDPHFTPLLARAVMRDGPRKQVARMDWVEDLGSADRLLREVVNNFKYVVAHNAPFEKRVLAQRGIYLSSERFIDSAVIARAAGAAGKLEAAGPQLLGVDKVEEGRDLMKLFSFPGEYQEKHQTEAFVADVVLHNPEKWRDYGYYCEVDATLGLDLALTWGWVLTDPELTYAGLTTDMNELGWHVDVKLVMEMERRYQENLAQAMSDFRVKLNEPDLNLNSLKQQKEWCAKRGIKATSFDEKSVERLLARLEAKIATMAQDDPKREGYCDVRFMLATKKILGGSSLKKLKVILENTSEDDRLHDQYLHVGAGQTWRTTGRSVQMQNLKRFVDEPADMSELEDLDNIWSNDELAENLRQVFTATDPQGHLIVGDFSSVESRGLAYLAGAEWKLRAYRQNKDMYKVLAQQIFNVPYDEVLKPQRQAGKVGELSCGYQASGPAVQEFAKGMSIEMSEGEATKLVSDWREVNPEIVAFWWKLDAMLHSVIEGPSTKERHELPYDNLVLVMKSKPAPDSLLKQHPGSKTLVLEIWQGGDCLLRRFFHGCYVRGRSICYYKPSELKGGDLWKQSYIHPKTKQRTFYSVYGGKLAGILTQSFCREIFFRVLMQVQGWVDHYSNIDVVGQFHDELVLDWKPAQGVLGLSHGLSHAMIRLEDIMSDPGSLKSFPLGADIKYDYRYIK